VAAGAITGGTNGTGGGLATTGSEANSNAGMYSYVQPVANFVALGDNEVTQVTNAQGTVNVTLGLSTGDNTSDAIAAINTQLNGIGVYAVADAAGTGFTLQSSSAFSLNKTTADSNGTGNVFGTAALVGAINLTNDSPTAASSSADAAITAITAAVGQLGLVQGRVGAGENQLNYAISLATSQFTNFTSAESQIRDANVAQQAANLTKAQVLQQASIAAMAQANSAPQQYLALLKT
jgi:flagellin